jgi:hypothetical protein
MNKYPFLALHAANMTFAFVASFFRIEEWNSKPVCFAWHTLGQGCEYARL